MHVDMVVKCCKQGFAHGCEDCANMDVHMGVKGARHIATVCIKTARSGLRRLLKTANPISVGGWGSGYRKRMLHAASAEQMRVL